MHDWQSLSHVRWECKYHVVIIPKYRRKVFYGRLRREIGPILRELCRQRGIELMEGHAMPDHVHLCLSIPPKYSVGAHNRVLEREECCSHPSGVTSRASDDGSTLLVNGILRQHGGLG